jgi:hypothetical protein
MLHDETSWERETLFAVNLRSRICLPVIVRSSASPNGSSPRTQIEKEAGSRSAVSGQSTKRAKL